MGIDWRIQSSREMESSCASPTGSMIQSIHGRGEKPEWLQLNPRSDKPSKTKDQVIRKRIANKVSWYDYGEQVKNFATQAHSKTRQWNWIDRENEKETVDMNFVGDQV